MFGTRGFTMVTNVVFPVLAIDQPLLLHRSPWNKSIEATITSGFHIHATLEHEPSTSFVKSLLAARQSFGSVHMP